MNYLPNSFPSDHLDSLEARRLEYFYEHFVVKRFDRYGFGHFALACYAALPAILTPDLVHKIWLNFKKYSVQGQDLNIHPVAPADLLLSPLVEEIGFELYEMPEPIRRALLLHLHQLSASPEDQPIQFFPLKEIAAFLLDYARQDRTPEHKEDDEFWEAQEWTALSYLNPAEALAKVGNAFANAPDEPTRQLQYRDAIEKMASRFDLGIVDHDNTVPGEYKSMRTMAHVMREIILNREAQLLDYFQQKEDWKDLLSDKAEEGDGLISIQIPDAVGESMDVSANRNKLRKVRALVIGVSGITASGWIQVGEEENNALLMKSLLESQIAGDILELQVMTAEAATKTAILEAWESIVKSAGIRDDLLFYLSCNGARHEGHCYAACFDSLPLTAETYATWLADEEIGLLAQQANCSSITAIIQVDHAASPYWLDISKPGNVLFASSEYEQEATTYKVAEDDKYYCGFTYALVQTLKKWEMSLSNSRLFIETLEAYENPPEDLKKQGSFSSKKPVLSGVPGTIERFFLHGENIYVRLQNLLRHAGDEDPVVSGKWDDETSKALLNMTKTAARNFTTKQDYIQYLKLETQKKEARDRPIFLFVFCDPEGNLNGLEQEKSAVQESFKDQIQQTNIDLILLENPTKQVFQDFFKNRDNRNRIHLFHFSGIGYPGGIDLADGKLSQFEFLKLLGYQRFICLAFFNACETDVISSRAVQCGVWNAIGIQGTVSDANATRFGIQFYRQWSAGQPTLSDAFQNTLEEAPEFVPEATIHRSVGIEKNNFRYIYLFERASWLATNLHGEIFGDYHLFARTDGRVHVFVNYSRSSSEDHVYYKEIERLLINLSQKAVVNYWRPNLIEDGDFLIERQVDLAEIFILLISADYFFDNECYQLHETILKQSRNRNLRIVPVLIRPVDIEGTDLESYRALPDAPDRESFLSKWTDPNEAYALIEQQLEQLAIDLRNPGSADTGFKPANEKEQPASFDKAITEDNTEVQTTGAGSKNIYALLVGINNYRPPVPQLHGCIADVQAMQAYLQALPDTRLHLMTLMDEQAVKNNIVAGFKEHLSQARAGDVALFYYSGQGTKEAADEVFWDTNPSQLLDALVCYDGLVEENGQQQFNLLADKELRYLLSELSKTNPQILTIFDCDFSGDNTRSQQPGLIRRSYAPKGKSSFHAPQRPWEQFIFSDKLPRETFLKQSVNELIPEGSYIQMSACAPDEKVFEKNGRGVFTSTMLDILNYSKGKLSYHDLGNRIRNTLKNKHQQTPQIFSTGDPDELFRNFMDIKGVKETELFGQVTYRSGQGWYLQLGFATEISPFAKEIEVLSLDGQQKFDAHIGKKTNDQIELLFQDATPDENGLYKAALSALLSGPLAIYFDVRTSQDDGLRFVEKAWQESKPNLVRTEDENEADYSLLISENTYSITKPRDQYHRPLTPVLNGFNSTMAKQVLDWLQHIARWEFVKALSNKNYGGLLSPMSIEVAFFKMDGTFEQPVSIIEDEIRLDYAQKTDGSFGCSIKIRLTNSSPDVIYLALLYLSMNFGSEEGLLRPSVVKLNPGDSLWAYEGKAIPLSLEEQVQKFNLPESITYFKFFASTESFDVTPLLLKELPYAAEIRHRGAGRVYPNYWTTRLITLRMPNPDYKEEMA